MLPEVTVTPKTKYGTELPIAQFGTFKKKAKKGLNAYNKYIFNKSKDAFGISGRMLMDDLTLPVANSANLMQHRSLANTYIPNLSDSDLNNYYKLITQYTINSEPFKFSSFPKNKEVSFPMQPSFMNKDGTPLYTFDNRFATQLNDIINSNKVIFKGDQNKPLTLVREFEGFTDVPVGKDFYFTKDYYGDMNKLNSYIDALKSGKAFNLNDISSWSVGANTGLNRFGSNRFIIEDFPLSQNALVNKYDSPLFSTNQKGIFRERELLLPSETQFKVKEIDNDGDDHDDNYYQCFGWYMLYKFECGRVSGSIKQEKMASDIVNSHKSLHIRNNLSLQSLSAGSANDKEHNDILYIL